MRVIAGTAKGRRLTAPKGPGTRPALAQVKESVFNILGPLTELTVLDLYAGSGAIGIEALSRGAARTTFVESAAPALTALRKNLEKCGFQEQAEVVSSQVERTLKYLARSQQRFDLIFVDPPYDCGFVKPTLEAVEKVLADAGTAIVEHSPREVVEETAALSITDQRKYGQTYITFLKLKD